MKRALWINDIHLDFLDEDAVDDFLRLVDGEKPDVVLLAGDISIARYIIRDLRRIERLIEAPVCFVLGNHDFYHGSIAGVRREVSEFDQRSEKLHWLNQSGVYELSETTAIVGHDGWGDARAGNFDTSTVELSDFFLIDELAGRDRDGLIRVLRELGDEAADHFRSVLPRALETHRDVVVVTHVPPFRDAAWYDGVASSDDWAPFFCCQAGGDAIREVASEFPDGRVTVLCGHTHGEGEAEILPNLRVLTGGARYRSPQIQAVLDLD